MNEKRRQQAKEKAVLLALQKDMALIRRGLEVHGIKKDGSTSLIVKAENYDTLWQETLEALES